MKQKAISLSPSFFIGKAVYLRDDGMERVREQRDVFCSSRDFMRREEFSGKLKILLQSFITHFQGSSSLLFHSHLFSHPPFIFSTSVSCVTVMFGLLQHVSFLFLQRFFSVSIWPCQWVETHAVANRIKLIKLRYFLGQTDKPRDQHYHP